MVGLTDLGKQIAQELEDRRATKNILNAQQFTLLRYQGMSREEVEQFELILKAELSDETRDSQVFIPTLWVKLRVEGRKPEDIGYDEVNMFR